MSFADTYDNPVSVSDTTTSPPSAPAATSTSETTPLLSPTNTANDSPEANLDKKYQDQSFLSALSQECVFMAQLAWPVSAGYLLQMSLGLAMVFSLGHVGTKELAASALATMYCNVTGFAVGMGMASALDTLCSQAHTGSTDPHAVGKHLQRAIVCMFFLSIPIAGLWMCTESVLVVFGQDRELAALAALFTKMTIPGLFPYFIYECQKRYLQAQGIMVANMYVILIASPINMLLQYTLVWSPLSIGVIGAPLASTITYTLLPILLGLYIKFIAGGEKYGGWSWNDALDLGQMWEFLRLGIPGIAMICSEWWAFEIVALAAGILGEDMLAAQTVVLQTCSLTYMLPLGISIAVSTRVG
ncbi:hypothetical protein HK102_004993, partial [Quaeritorhiza haematococci]